MKKLKINHNFPAILKELELVCQLSPQYSGLNLSFAFLNHNIKNCNLSSFNPTKHLCILAQHIFGPLMCNNFLSGADYLLFCCYLGRICIKFGAYLPSKFKNHAILDEFSYHHGTKVSKSTTFNASLALFQCTFQVGSCLELKYQFENKVTKVQWIYFLILVHLEIKYRNCCSLGNIVSRNYCV